MVKKWFTKRYLIIGKNPPFWGFTFVWGTFPWSKSKNSFRFEFPMPKNPPVQKISHIGKLFENSIFYLKGRPRGKKNEFSKSFPIWLIFYIGLFFGMGNSNPKEFFDFDHGKVPHKGLKPKNGGFTSYGAPLCKSFLTIFLRSRAKNNGGFVFSA